MELRWSLKKSQNNSLLTGYLSALKELAPKKLIRGSRPQKDSAILCWGKAADDFYRAIPHRGRAFVISPKKSNHPIPGKKSFQAGQNLVRFFDDLDRHSVKNLAVYLSGGASSLAWIPEQGISHGEVVRRLKVLYRKPLSIRDLNRERAKLCQLKSGGAAFLAGAIAPDLKIQVFAVSDVSPFGPEILGGAPFFSRNIPHILLADNATLRGALKRKLKAKDLGFVEGLMKNVFAIIEKTIRLGKPGTSVFGCEASVLVPSKHGKGGRQTHLACLLLKEFQHAIQTGKLEILCMSSDGSDGTSGAAGALLTADTADISEKEIDHALKAFDSARVLKSIGALVHVLKTATNVQDVVVIRILK
jgi:glycerate 2-kinase